jgi:hypothetical protein
MGAAANLMQRVMLMRALQQKPQPQQPQPPNPNTPQTQINLPQPGGQFQPNPMMDV